MGQYIVIDGIVVTDMTVVTDVTVGIVVIDVIYSS